MGFFIIEALIAAFIIFVAVMLDRRMRTRSAEAWKAVSEQSEEFRREYWALRVKSYWKGFFAYIGAFAAFLIVSIIGVNILTVVQEPRADFMIQVFMGVFVYGLVVLPIIIVAGFMTARIVQGAHLRKFLKAQPQAAAIERAHTLLTPRVGELGVSAAAIIAIVLSAVSGLAILAFLFMASQAAIECARSAKCL